MTVIKPAPRWPQPRHLPSSGTSASFSGTLVWRDVVVRYKQTFLGIAWAILVPIFTAVVYVIVFGKFADFPSGDMPYPSLVIAGVLPMQYFASALTGSSMSLAANLHLVTKVYFPRTLLPLAAVIVPLVDFVVGLPVLLVAHVVLRHLARWAARCSFAPLFMALAFVTALGIRALPVGGQRPLSATSGT